MIRFLSSCWFYLFSDGVCLPCGWVLDMESEQELLPVGRHAEAEGVVTPQVPGLHLTVHPDLSLVVHRLKVDKEPTTQPGRGDHHQP